MVSAISAQHLLDMKLTKISGSERRVADFIAGDQARNLAMTSLFKKQLVLSALPFVFALTLVGCQPEGPAEKAGKGLDNAGKDLKDAVDPRGPAQKAGDKIDEVTGAK